MILYFQQNTCMYIKLYFLYLVNIVFAIIEIVY